MKTILIGLAGAVLLSGCAGYAEYKLEQKRTQLLIEQMQAQANSPAVKAHQERLKRQEEERKTKLDAFTYKDDTEAKKYIQNTKWRYRLDGGECRAIEKEFEDYAKEIKKRGADDIDLFYIADYLKFVQCYSYTDTGHLYQGYASLAMFRR